MSLAQRSINSIGWNAIGNTSGVAILFVRSVLLARWLPVEVFGIYAGANAIVVISSILIGFGMEGAFLNRVPQTENEREAADVLFTLKFLFALLWAAALSAWALRFTTGSEQLAILLLIFTTSTIDVLGVPVHILVRRVEHKRIALVRLLHVILSTIVALGLASQNMGLWSLLATDLVAVFTVFAGYHLWRPIWRPRFSWLPATVRYYLSFGSRNFLATLLLRALDRVDDLWTRYALGQTPLGFYSRAYTFAVYPRQVVARPVNIVVGGTFAELKSNRLKLSQAFFRTTALLVRTGFFMAGVLALVAPEFIRLLIGAKWLPMLDAFRLMLVFTMLDPLKAAVANLFVAVGKPEKIVRARLVQLAVLLAGLFTLGPIFGIAGVALAVDLMLVLGIGILMWQAREFVDISLRTLFLTPSFALTLGMILAKSALSIPGIQSSDWSTGAAKLVVFTMVYGGVMLIFERRQTRIIIENVRRILIKDDGILSRVFTSKSD